MKYTQGQTFETIINDGKSVWFYTDDSAAFEVIPQNVTSEKVTGTKSRTDGVTRLGPFYKKTVIRITATLGDLDVRNYEFQNSPIIDDDFQQIMNATGGMTPDEIGEAIKSSTAISGAAGNIIGKLRNNTSDVVVLVNGDSTGNETHEWAYRLAEWYGSQYPEYTVLYYLWNTGTNDYDSAETISTGAGSNTLHFYNGSVGGSRPDYMLGFRFDNFCRNIPNADLYILNHGQNMTDTTYDAETFANRVGLYYENITQVIETHSGAGCIVIGQNPRRLSDAMNVCVDAARFAAGELGCDYLDVHYEFIKRDKDIELYATGDTVHPSYMGQTLFLNLITKAHSVSSFRSARNAIARRIENLITNGDFSSYTTATYDIPTGFTRSGNAATTEDAVVFNLADGSTSLKMEPINPGSGNVFVQYQLSAQQAAKCEGKKIVVGMRFKLPNISTPATAAAIELRFGATPDPDDIIKTYEHDNQPLDRFVWRFLVVDVPAGETVVKINFYADSSSTGHTINVSRVFACVGSLPGSF